MTVWKDAMASLSNKENINLFITAKRTRTPLILWKRITRKPRRDFYVIRGRYNMEASVEGVWVFHARIYSRVVEVSLNMQIPLD